MLSTFLPHGFCAFDKFHFENEILFHLIQVSKIQLHTVLAIRQVKLAVFHLRGNHAVTLYEKREKIRYYLRVWHLG